MRRTRSRPFSRKEDRVSKLEKAKILLSEAKEDLKHGSYNKAVSASYFAVRLAAEHFIAIRTSKDDKIANALYRRMRELVGEERAEEVRLDFLELFSLRKYADHRGVLFDREEAEEIVGLAEGLLLLIVTNLGRETAPTGGG